jgi:hypothetical protein
VSTAPGGDPPLSEASSGLLELEAADPCSTKGELLDGDKLRAFRRKISSLR